MAIRLTVNLDDDVRAEIDALRKERGATSKEIVNEALRLGQGRNTTNCQECYIECCAIFM